MTTETATTTEARYIDTAEAAKILRTALKIAFPGVKFSVKTSRYSMGSSIYVSYVDGPIQSQVDEIARPFSGKGFDGMIDASYQKYSWLTKSGRVYYAGTDGTRDGRGVVDSEANLPPTMDAELVRFSCYVNVSRNESVEFMNRVLARYIRQRGPQDITIRECAGSGYTHCTDSEIAYRFNRVVRNCYMIGNVLVEVKE